MHLFLLAALVASPALDALIKQAEKELQTPPLSVMHKTLTAASGDKHDYMSIGPYWWPDPTKPGGLPYIRKDGERNPERNDDRTDSVELHRMFNSTATLMLAYHETGREDFAAQAAKLLRGWFLDPATRMNPNLNYGQAVPGRVEGRGTGIIDTAGLIETTRYLPWLAKSPSWTASDQEGMTKWFAAYLKWLQTSKNGTDEAKSANNHGTWYDAQVVSLAIATGQVDLAKKVLEAAKKKRIDSQIREDGSEPLELARTNSLSYSTMNTRAFVELATMGQEVGVDLWHTRIQKALDFLLPYVKEDSKWTHEQIDGVKVSNRMEIATLMWRAGKAYGESGGRFLVWLCPPAPSEWPAARAHVLWEPGVEVLCH